MWVFWVTNSETGGFKIVCLVLIILLHIFSAGKIRARVLICILFEYLMGVMGQVQVKPVPQHIPDPDWGSEHQGGGWVVCWQAYGLYLQGQSEEEWESLSLHLG